MTIHQRMSDAGLERGTAIVEFAIILPLLLMLLFGIVEYGRAYNVKVQLTGSVLEGARALALGKTTAQVKQAVRDAAPGLNPALSDANITIVTTCLAGGADSNAKVTISYHLLSLTPLVPTGYTNLNVTGVMRCGL